MSIIAVRDRTIAADRGQTYGETIDRAVQAKIFRSNRLGGFCGSVGNVGDCWLFRQWAEGAGDFPLLESPGSFDSLLLRDDGTVWRWILQNNFYPVSEPFAIGCCYPFAMGAMAAGASAFHAVELCAIHCVSVRAPVDFISLSTSQLWDKEAQASAALTTSPK